MSEEARRRLEEYKARKYAGQRSAVSWYERGEGVLPDPPQAEPPEPGSRLTFTPAPNVGNMGSGDIQGVLHRPVTGTVVQIHRAHRWYRVAYQMGDKPGCIGYECFKF